MTCLIGKLVNVHGGGFGALVRLYLEDHDSELPDALFNEENYEREVADLKEELEGAIADRWLEWCETVKTRYSARDVADKLRETRE